MSLSLFRKPLAYVAFLFPIVIVFENKLTAVFLIGILGGVVLLVRPLKTCFWTPLIVGFGLFLVWALLSALWSIDPMHSLTRFMRLSLTVAGGVLLCGVVASQDFKDSREVGISFAAGFLIASVISISARFWAPYAPHEAVAVFIEWMPLLSFGAIAVLCIFVLIAMLEERPISVLIPVAIVAGVVAIVFRGNSASSVALVAGIIAFAFVFWLGRKAVITMAIALPLLFLSLPISLQAIDIPARAKAMGLTLDNSAGHRLIVWRFVNKEIQKRPGLGWGLHTSRILPGRDGRVVDDPDYADILEVTNISRQARIELMPMHPHNASLQSWLELGGVGAVLYAALFGLVLLAMSRMSLSRMARAAGASAVTAAFVIGQLSFSAWQSWWLCTQFLMATFFLFMVRKAADSKDLAEEAGPGGGRGLASSKASNGIVMSGCRITSASNMSCIDHPRRVRPGRATTSTQI